MKAGKCIICGKKLTKEQIKRGAIVCSKECFTILLDHTDKMEIFL